MSQRKGLFVWYEDAKTFELLSDEQLGKLIRNLVKYSQSGEAPTLDDPAVAMAFRFMANRDDYDSHKYEEICEKRREAGKKGGRPPKANGFSENQKVSQESKQKQKKLIPVPEPVPELVPEQVNKGDIPLTPLGKDSHTTTSDTESLFSKFWDAYPKKVGKGAARKAWEKLRPSKCLTNQMLSAISVQRQSAQWTKDRGQYIPNPATWLNQGRWEDDLTGGFANGTAQQGVERNAEFYTAGFHRADE